MKEKGEVFMIELLGENGIFFIDLDKLFEVNAFPVEELELGVSGIDFVVFILLDGVEKDALFIELVDGLDDFSSKVIDIIDLQIAVENHLKYDRLV